MILKGDGFTKGEKKRERERERERVVMVWGFFSPQNLPS